MSIFRLSGEKCSASPVDRGAWRATVHGVAKSQARLAMNTSTFASLSASPTSV